MKTEDFIDRFLEIVDRDGKNGGDITIAYAVSVIREIINEQTNL